jgi:hypothetical protein
VQTQLGNVHGVAQPGTQSNLLASVTADNGTDNIVNVDSLANLKVGDVIDILHRTTGVATAGATNRTITNLKNNGGTFEVTYSGADVDPTNAYGLYYTGTFGEKDDTTNLNGGRNNQEGLTIPELLSVEAAKTFLTAYSSSEYTTDRFNNMTWNDIVYAVRQAKGLV